MVKIPKVPKGLRVVFAILAILIIIAFVVIMGFMIYQKTSNMLGLSQTPIVNCTDTDNGNLQEVFGTCTDSTKQSKSDTCVLTGLREEYKLQEWFCENNACTSEIKSCQAGFICQTGRCIKT